MSCTACNGWLFRGDCSRYAPLSRAALCLTHTQVINRFAHQSNLSHCARSWALSRCIAVAWVSRHEWAADGRSASGGRRCIRPWGRQEACRQGQHLTAVAGMPARRPGCLRHREHLQPSLTQRDMWVLHSPAGAGWGKSHISPALSARASRAQSLSLALHLTAKVRNARDNLLTSCR
ncbi:MAG: hypothetical protein KatS3mg054_0685 [Chloroflexus sp.]|jgi:hypothetical protein|nr:MAG: hypothetical protein D6716_18180 [Chloroflexota bacterium]GIV86656.1 MAG: hypothetical protein KatS3mg054_0685 [Chloroflexus sp.]GIV93145.1 MAG: hypothetical protein KatS3mg056_1854 [Chloroflexus sp.]HBW66916.1 hypothetical protein [Chloroflexus aurantiacus]